MPVQRSTIFAISSSVTLSRRRLLCLALCASSSLVRELLLQLGQLAVFQARGRLEVIALLGLLDLRAQRFDALAELLHLADGVFLVFPLRFRRVELLAQLGKLLAQLSQTPLRKLVSLVLERGLLNLHLDDLAAHDVQLGRHGVHLGADHGAGLVDEVNGLVGQEAVGDIPVGEGRGGDDRRVGDLHAVEDLVALLQTAQDGDRVLHGRLVDHDGLEAALERRILFNVFAVFVERGRADAVQLAARQHRLEQVARVHAALGLARADDRVQLVDEEQDASLRGLDLVQNRLQALLKFAAVFCAGDQRAHIQREDRLVLKRLRHVAAHDALRQPLGDGRLADARLADEHRVVLRLAREDADDVSGSRRRGR